MQEEYHVLSPHRDDAFLTFGGYILGLRAKYKKVFIHVIYGTDNAMRELFLEELLIKRLKHSHYKMLKKMVINDDILLKEVEILLKKDNLNNKDLFHIGILIRRLEDKLVAQHAECEIIEYNYPAGFPFRGYKNAISKLNKDDLNEQISFLMGKKRRGFTNKRLIKLGLEFDVINSPYLYFQDRLKRNNNLKIIILCPAGIGHPDHLIISYFGQIMDKFKNNRLEVIYGQDFPYALVQEWFQQSILDFSKYDKKIISIVDHYMNKIKLISLYKSQLSSNDLMLAKIYPILLNKLISRDFLLSGLEKIEQNNIPVEVQYVKKK